MKMYKNNNNEILAFEPLPPSMQHPQYLNLIPFSPSSKHPHSVNSK